MKIDICKQEYVKQAREVKCEVMNWQILHSLALNDTGKVRSLAKKKKK